MEIERYPEIRASGGRPGPLLVEEVDRDPLMDGVASYLSAVPIRSVLCQRVPETEDLILHAVRDREPFGLSDVAFFRAAARLLASTPSLGATRAAATGPRRDAEALALAIRSIPDAAAVLTANDEIRFANAPFLDLTGRLESELVGLSFGSFLRPAEPGDAFAPPLPLAGGEEYEVKRARIGRTPR